jgi:glucan 1,3-beta-glucosidase
LLAVDTAADPIRGVNLGGWLVLEPWITPNLFEKANEGVERNSTDNSTMIVDEWTWHKTDLVGTHNRTQMLEEHWQTWVTQEHLQTLREAGVTHLRIPVGYWYFVQDQTEIGFDDPFSSGIATDSFPLARQLLKQVVNDWAAPLGLKVLIDLHTGPGSQNGFDNSGRRGPLEFMEGNNIARWSYTVHQLTTWITQNLDESTVWGIEILNEPFGAWGLMHDTINQVINPLGYKRVRDVSSGLQVIFQTGFTPVSEQRAYTEPQYHNVWFDDHYYQCFGGDNARAWNGSKQHGWDGHLTQSCLPKYAPNVMDDLWTFVGEWSLAVTDCTKYLAGGINGGCDMKADPTCVYRGTPEQSGHPEICEYYNQPYQNFTAEYKQFLQNFARAQMDGFEIGQGWFFWNFRTENNHAPAWDFLLGLQEGWIDQNVGARPKYCSFR